MLKKMYPNAKLVVWSRSAVTAGAFKAKMEARGWSEVSVVKEPAGLGQCDIVIASTPSEVSLLNSVKQGSLVVAIGADARGKRELGPLVLKGACVVCDSKVQCMEFGEVAHAVKEGTVKPEGIAELGVLLAGAAEDGKVDLERLGMKNKTVVVDLTGVAVQDVIIASLVLESLETRAASPSKKNSVVS